MATSEIKIAHRVLLVDDDAAVRGMMTAVLIDKGFEVVAASNVAEGLRYISTERFDVLISDLHMPKPGDGFTVVSAMRHSQPDALTIIVSGYPDVKGAMAAILLEVDEIIVKPINLGSLCELVSERLLTRKAPTLTSKERVGAILHRCMRGIIDGWLARAKAASELNHIPLSDADRTGHLPKLVEDLVARLSNRATPNTEGAALFSAAAAAHGKLRFEQSYTPAMLVHESRILQVTLFGTLQDNLNHLDFSLLLPDVMTIADEVDAQLTQSMESFMNVMRAPAAA